MNRALKRLVRSLTAVLILGACAMQPHQEINSAKNAVDAATAEGAEKYDPDAAKRLNSELNAAMAEVKSQGSRFFRNYEKAKELLSKTKADADGVRAGLGAKKEELKKRAYDSRESARSSLENAEILISPLMKRKKAGPEMEAVRVDFQVLEMAMSSVQELLDNEDYLAAAIKADFVRNHANALSDRLKQMRSKTEVKPPKYLERRKKRGD